MRFIGRFIAASAKEAAIKILSPRLRRFLDLRALRACEIDGDILVEMPGEASPVRVRSVLVGRVILSLGIAETPHVNVM